jgi:membrane fusion protein, multidrug efflux system
MTGNNQTQSENAGVTPAAGPTPGNAARQGRRGLWILVLFILVAASVGYFAYKHYSTWEETDDAQIDGHINPVAARVGGTILSVKIADDMVVKKGDLLIQIDPKDYQVAFSRAQAELREAEAVAKAAASEIPVTATITASQVDAAQAAMQRAEKGVAVAAKEIETARAGLALAQARVREAEPGLSRARQDLDRLKPLMAKEEIPKQQYDYAVTAVESAQASKDSATAAAEAAQKQIEAAEARLAQLRQNIPEAKAQLDSANTAPQRTAISRSRAEAAEARIGTAQAALEQAKLNLGYTSVYAPMDGIVSAKNVEPGQTIQAGQPLFALVSLDDIWIRANFKENQVRELRPGLRVEIKVDANGSKVYKGQVESIAAATGAKFSLLPAENATGNYVKVVQRIPVKIRFDEGQDPEHLLRPGMSVVPSILLR